MSSREKPITLIDRIDAYMRGNPGVRVSAPGIAELFVNDLYADFYQPKGKTPPQLSAEINGKIKDMMESGKYPQIVFIEDSRPKEYYWDEKATAQSTGAGFKPAAPTTPKVKTKTGRRNNQPEEELYEPLIDYLTNVQGIKPFRIKANPSRWGHRGRGKGIHPDIVGVRGVPERRRWDPQVREMADLIKPIQAKLWSFELKKDVTRNDVYTHYQQAVSNSSWANFGYLCVGDIDSPETKEKLHMFHKMHGIGVILVDKNEPMKTRIEIEAKERPVDLNFCHTLSKNGDFKKFLTKAINVYKTGDVS